MYVPPGIMFYTGLQTYEDFTFVLVTLGDAAYELNYLYDRSEQLPVFLNTDQTSATQDKL